MARLFDRDRTVIVRHVRNIYQTKELDRNSTCAKNAQVAADGKVRSMDLFNLDMIISVGYRVNSKRGTQFRIWATQIQNNNVHWGSVPVWEIAKESKEYSHFGNFFIDIANGN